METTDDRLRAILEEQWGLPGGRVVSRHQTWGSRLITRIQTAGEDLAVKINKEPHPSVLNGAQVQAHVALHCPGLAARVHPTLAGELAADIGGCQLIVTDWVEGSPPDDAPATWAKIGEALGRLHNAPAADHQFAIPVQGAAEELTAQAAGYAFGEPFLDLITRVRSIPPTPAATIHGEINAANARQRSNGEIAFLDWDEAGTGATALDLGYPLISVFLSYDLRWNRAAAAAFYAAYFATTTSTAPNATDIFSAALLHAMRYVDIVDRDLRWSRIEHAVNHETELLAALSSDRREHSEDRSESSRP